MSLRPGKRVGSGRLLAREPEGPGAEGRANFRRGPHRPLRAVSGGRGDGDRRRLPRRPRGEEDVQDDQIQLPPNWEVIGPEWMIMMMTKMMMAMMMIIDHDDCDDNDDNDHGDAPTDKPLGSSTVCRYFAMVGRMGDQEIQVERRVIASSLIVEAIGRISRRGLSAWPQGTRRQFKSLRQVYGDRLQQVFPNYQREQVQGGAPGGGGEELPHILPGWH